MSRKAILVVVIVGIVVVAVVGAVLRRLQEAGSYESTCVLMAGQCAERDGPAADAKDRAARVAVEMLRYDRVMAALEDTDIVRDIVKRSGDNSGLRSLLQEDLHRRIVSQTKVEPMADTLIRVSCRAETPDEACLVLTKLVTSFVENATADGQTAARLARELARAELHRATEALASAEDALVTFCEEHPGAMGNDGAGGAREALREVLAQLARLDREVANRQRRLTLYNEKLKTLSKGEDPGTAHLRTALELQVLESTADLGAYEEERRVLQLRKTALEEQCHTLPGLEQHVRLLERQRAAAADRHEAAQQRFDSADSDFRARMEGATSFSVVDPPRRQAAPLSIWRRLFGG